MPRGVSRSGALTRKWVLGLVTQGPELWRKLGLLNRTWEVSSTEAQVKENRKSWCDRYMKRIYSIQNLHDEWLSQKLSQVELRFFHIQVPPSVMLNHYFPHVIDDNNHQTSNSARTFCSNISKVSFNLEMTFHMMTILSSWRSTFPTNSGLVAIVIILLASSTGTFAARTLIK